jgi:hypothetical protein
MVKHTVLVLAVAALALASAQTPSAADTVSRAEVVLAARQALEAASRNLNRWLTAVIVAVLAGAALAVWRVWALGRRLQRLEDMRAAWEARFADTADEVLRLKRKLAEEANTAARLEADIAALRPAALDAATAQVAMVQSGLVAARERLDRVEEKLEAVVDHTVVTKQERVAVEEMVKTAGQARVAAEAAATRAEGIAKRAAAADALRVGDAKLVQRQYPAAVQAYAECLESLDGCGADDPVTRFHAFHNRALANLRQREFDAVLADAAALQDVALDRAQGAALLLAGIARLWQGEVAQALDDLSAAVECDPGARAAILQDEDIAAWVKVNPRKAGPVKRFVKSVGRKPAKPKRPSSKRRPAGARPKPKGKSRR